MRSITVDQPCWGAQALAGLTVLVTRPQPQANQLATQLRAAGAEPVVWPLIEIVPVALSVQEEVCVAELDRYSGVICISAAAAELGVRLCADRWPQWPLHQTWYAVGPASGRPLQGWGLNLVVADAGSSSETLLALPALQAVDGQKFLIFRGNGGRETLADTLRSRGAQVDYLEIYRRQPVHNDRTRLDSFLAAAGRPIVTVTSGETLDQLLIQAGDRAPGLRQCPLVVVSGRLAEHARQQGFPDVHIAAGASDDALMRCLHAILSTQKTTRLP
jgi:uroporphyrinogen-III synthase